MSRPLVATLDLAAIAANVERARRFAPAAELLAVVKANAYGHGLRRILPALDRADGIALIELDAALQLRASGYAKPILLLEGFFEPSELDAIAKAGISVVVHDVEQVRMLEASSPVSPPLDIYVKANSGMNRLGLPLSEFAGVARRLAENAAVARVTLMTHFASADEERGLAAPLARFNAACADLPYRRSLANSAGVVRYAAVGGDVVRPGIMLYGATPFATRTAQSLGLEPAMTLSSRIIGAQTIAPGDTVGYGGTFRAARRMRIGVVACGYADGYPRHAPNGTPVLVAGHRVPTAGRVSMDMLTVDLTDVPDARAGSEVVLWGDGLPVDDVAAAASTVGYELLCAVAPRVPFVVREQGEG